MASRAFARVEDPTSHSGAAIVESGQGEVDFVFSEGLPVAVLGAPIENHTENIFDVHNGEVIDSEVSEFIFVGGIPLALNGSVASCGAVVEATTLLSFGD